VLQESNGINFEGTTDLTKLDYIELAFASLIFRHEGLRATEPISQTHLGEA